MRHIPGKLGNTGRGSVKPMKTGSVKRLLGVVSSLGLILLALLASLFGQQQSGNALVGSWKLVFFENQTTTGEVSYPLGRQPVGLLIYDAKGWISVHVMKPGRPNFKAGDRVRGTPEEIKTAFEGYAGYYGRYTVDERRQTVTHHVEASSFPNEVGMNLERAFTLSGRRLILKTVPRLFAGQTGTGTLVWERLD